MALLPQQLSPPPLQLPLSIGRAHPGVSRASPRAQSWRHARDPDSRPLSPRGDRSGTPGPALHHTALLHCSPSVFQNHAYFLYGHRCQGLAGSHRLPFWEKKEFSCVPLCGAQPSSCFISHVPLKGVLVCRLFLIISNTNKIIFNLEKSTFPLSPAA